MPNDLTQCFIPTFPRAPWDFFRWLLKKEERLQDFPTDAHAKGINQTYLMCRIFVDLTRSCQMFLSCVKTTRMMHGMAGEERVSRFDCFDIGACKGSRGDKLHEPFLSGSCALARTWLSVV